jgi:hypothetical protein
MEEQQVGSLKEALRNVSGLTFNAAEGGRSGDNMNLRGFYTFGDMYLDGIRDTAQYNRETFNLRADRRAARRRRHAVRPRPGRRRDQPGQQDAAARHPRSKVTGSVGTTATAKSPATSTSSATPPRCASTS